MGKKDPRKNMLLTLKLARVREVVSRGVHVPHHGPFYGKYQLYGPRHVEEPDGGSQSGYS